MLLVHLTIPDVVPGAVPGAVSGAIPGAGAGIGAETIAYILSTGIMFWYPSRSHSPLLVPVLAPVLKPLLISICQLGYHFPMPLPW